MVENDDWLAVVPFWAAWPFETLLLPPRPATRLRRARRRPRATRLAGVLIALLGRYDNLFDTPFPYSMGWHQAPFGERRITTTGSSTPTSSRRSWLATVRKFMVGYELLAEPQRDITAEEAAERLRAVPPVTG